MIRTEVPGLGVLEIAYIVCDYNGTLAVDGELLPGVAELINGISGAEVHVITADTFGVARAQLAGIRCRLSIAPDEDQAVWKCEYVKSLNAANTAAIGNGRNDRLMLKEAALSIAILQKEGASVEALMQAQLVCASIVDALEYFTNPKRLIASLRS